MKIEKKLDDGNLTIKVEGRLDTNTSPELEDEMNLDGVSKLVFDFSGLEYISSAGLRILIAAQKAMSANGGSMAAKRPPLRAERRRVTRYSGRKFLNDGNGAIDEDRKKTR